MSSLTPNEVVVKEGVFFYDGSVECDVRIVCTSIRYGSGDYEDEPEIANDLERKTFTVQYGSTTERGIFNAEGGAYSSLKEAIDSAESAPGIGSTIRWR